MFACIIFILGLRNLLVRADALDHANLLVREDARHYRKVFKEKLAESVEVRQDIEILKAVWNEVMTTAAVDGNKRQSESFATIETLFNACDLLNPLFLLLFRRHCERSGGEFHSANVKGEDRALQKVYRSYREDWHLLTDLNRCFAQTQPQPQCRPRRRPQLQ